MTPRLNKLLSDSVHEGTPPLWYVEDEFSYEEMQQANNADAERAEQEFSERFERADLGFDLTDGTRPSLWARLCGFVAWMFSKPSAGDKS